MTRQIEERLHLVFHHGYDSLIIFRMKKILTTVTSIDYTYTKVTNISIKKYNVSAPDVLFCSLAKYEPEVTHFKSVNFKDHLIQS